MGSTMRKTLDDVNHFLVLFVVLFGLLAFFAHFTFSGASPNEFGSMTKALVKQFELIIGYGDDWPWRALDNMDPIAAGMFMIYVSIFVLVVFFVMLNFFIGIILQGFFATKEEIDELVVENSFWYDMIDVIITYRQYFRNKNWPTREETMKKLEENEDRIAVTVADLLEGGGFRDKESATNFLNYYCDKQPALLDDIE